MNTTEYILLIAPTICCLLMYWYIKLLVARLDLLERKCGNKDLQYDIMLTHIAGEIMKEALDREDYETAKTAKEIIDSVGSKQKGVNITITKS